MRPDLKQGEIRRMFELMEANYDKVNYDMFHKDLLKKDSVGVIKDDQGTIQGFTTYVINPDNCGTDDYSIIFSGDTIIHPQYWGTQVLMKGWCYTVGYFASTNKEVQWYWYLLSKGHRTYMYLPLFFSNFYPTPKEDSTPNLAVIADAVSQTLFAAYWQKSQGIIAFDKSLGELKPALAEGTRQRSKNKFVEYFLQRNPDFDKGHEMVCIAPLKSDNLRRTAKTYFDYGYNRVQL